MSGNPPAKQSPTKPKAAKEKKNQQGSSGNDRLKTVIRRLPPNLPEDVFWQSVQSWVTEDTVVWKAFHPGKVGKRINKENIPSRAYIAFKNEAQLAVFSREYDGHVFRDKSGNESQAVVEFAPYQKIPTEKKKADARNATIEKDEDYLSFLESLNASSKVEPVSLEALIAASQPPPPPTTTPLLEALKAEKSAQKDKEAILRHHAHYKDGVTVLAPPSKKEETKKKPAASAAPKQPELAQTSKKAAKKAAQKNVQAAQNAATNTPASAGSSNAPAPVKQIIPAPAKPPRPAREQQARQQQAKPSASAAAPQPAQAGIAEAASVSEVTGTSGTTPAPRRTRPVIGLGRQFEAALSGAGVGVGDQRKRREREKSKDQDSKPMSSDGGNASQKAKEGGGIRRDGKLPSSGGPATVPNMQLPSILQRNDGLVGPQAPVILQRPHTPRIMTRPTDNDITAETSHGLPDNGANRGSARRGRVGKRGVPRGG